FENIINEKKGEREKGYKTGVKQGEKMSHEKFNKILEEVVMRDSFLMAMVALGVVVAKCDKDYYEIRMEELEKIIGDVVNNPKINDNLKKQIVYINKSIYRFQDVEVYLSKIDIQGLKYLDSLVNSLVAIKKMETKNDIFFQNQWQDYLNSRGMIYDENNENIVCKVEV
ncbi:MAG: hypothetical protein RSA05_07400, partial [Cetobacterium sp.]